jgi:hypothetical protein
VLVDEGRPAGVVLMSARSADLLDWRLGNLCRIAHVRAGPALSRGAARGPIDVNAGRAPSRFLDQVAGEAARLAGERGWERLLIAGDLRRTRPLVNALPSWLRQRAVLGSRHLTEIDGPVLAVAVAERLASEHAEQPVALARAQRSAS